ncbi:MAG: DNA-3-methyladenine glycosylase I [Planctomycetota bacterium]
MPNADLVADDRGVQRCRWCIGDATYQQYHDHEWGYPIVDPYRLFEKICLEGFQAGLSWLTILKRRPRFREVFAEFDFHVVSQFVEKDIDRLLQDRGIIRHRGKIQATIDNASRAIEMEHEPGGLAAFFWSFEPSQSKPRHRFDDIPAKTVESNALSRELKRRGWKFVGPTTCYAFMQSMGIVNDHLKGCDQFEVIEEARRQMARPTLAS